MPPASAHTAARTAASSSPEPAASAGGSSAAGIVIAGTGSIGWGVVGGTYRVGGWGLPLSDEGSGAWLGAAAMSRVLRADDGRTAWSGLLRRLFDEFDVDPHAVVRWAAAAAPRDFAALAPTIVEHAAQDDPAG